MGWSSLLKSAKNPLTQQAKRNKKKKKKKKTFAQRTLEADAPFINESVNILADWISPAKEAPAAKKAEKRARKINQLTWQAPRF